MAEVDADLKKLKVVSLFSGIGGMDLGVEGGFKYQNKPYQRLPYEVIFATDFDPRAVEIYNRNFKRPAVLADIRDLSASEIPDHDVLTGGFPCQSFSVAATNPPRLGYKDLRGQLFFEIVRILKEKQPASFIAENVKGLKSANSGKAFPLVIEEFTKAGYFVTWKLLNATEFGVPQKRERIFIVGFRDKAAFDRFKFPEPSFSVPTTLGTVLEREVGPEYFFSDKAVAGMKTSKNSQIMNKGRAQPSDKPCNTVGAHLAKVSLNSTDPVFLEGGRYRMFTPREVARIQSFPENFVLEGSRSALYRGLGNAVAPLVMWHVSNSVRKALGL